MIIQNRWRIEGNSLVYYGIRNRPHTILYYIKLSNQDLIWLSRLANVDMSRLTNRQKRLISEGIVVNDKDYIPLVDSLDNAKFCTKCASNDYIIPGLEFNSDGLCPICDGYSDTHNLVSINPIIEDIPHNKHGMYDVAVFYTGGKDSTYLLWHLACAKKLRVLALTWKIPFISESAQKSIDNARKLLHNVTFVEWQVADCELAKFYKKLFELQDNTCACPSLAYLLFFPMLSSMNVPYLVLGNEPAQIKNLFFNNIAPKIAYKYHKSKALDILFKVSRVLTLKKPISLAQFNYLMVVKQLVYGENFIKKMATSKFQTLDNLFVALDEIEGFKSMLKRAIKRADRGGNITAFVQIDMNKISGGCYNWDSVKEIIKNQVGWVDATEQHKGLHTSCRIERAKEYSQFHAFREMKTTTVPFSAIELACAVNEGAITRDAAIMELRESSGFTLEPPCEHCEMRDYIDKFFR